MRNDDDERLALVRTARAGDVEAFTRLIQAHMASALAYATWRLSDPQRAEDAVQEACIEAYFHLLQLREPAAFTTWFRLIVRKQVDRIRRGQPAEVRPLDEVMEHVADDTDVTAFAERAEQRELVHTALGALSSAARDVAELFYLGDLSHQQIAASLSVPVTTVKKRLHDARRQLRTRIELLEGQPPEQRGASTSASLLTRVRFFIALRCGASGLALTMLRRLPELAHAREEWSDTLATLYHIGPPGKFTPLHHTAALGMAEVASHLIACGADLEARASQGQTPLHTAVLNSRPTLVSLLVRAGADPNCRSTMGMTPLHWASIRGDDLIMALLEAAGAKDDCADVSGRTPRDWLSLRHPR